MADRVRLDRAHGCTERANAMHLDIATAVDRGDCHGWQRAMRTLLLLGDNPHVDQAVIRVIRVPRAFYDRLVDHLAETMGTYLAIDKDLTFRGIPIIPVED